MKFKEITLQKILDKSQKRDSKIKLNNDIAKKLTESNNEYQMFENKINLNYGSLSKYSQDQLEKLCSIGHLLKLRDLDDDTLISEYVRLDDNEEELREKLFEKSNELESLLKIEEAFNTINDTFVPCKDEINTKLKEFINFENDINDRIYDILDPKSEEYNNSILKGKVLI